MWNKKKSHTLLYLVATTERKKRCNKKRSGVIRETEKLNEKEFIKFKIGKYYDRYQNNRISNWKTKAFKRTN